MTPKEFKAWFEGFTEAMEGMPTEAQWEKIKLRVGQIDGTPVTYPVYLDRYWPRRWVDDYPQPLRAYLSGRAVSTTLDCSAVTYGAGKVTAEQFAPLPAMKALGMAEYREGTGG
jgi:hypothetical protein